MAGIINKNRDPSRRKRRLPVARRARVCATEERSTIRTDPRSILTGQESEPNPDLTTRTSYAGFIYIFMDRISISIPNHHDDHQTTRVSLMSMTSGLASTLREEISMRFRNHCAGRETLNPLLECRSGRWVTQFHATTIKHSGTQCLPGHTAVLSFDQHSRSEQALLKFG